MTCSIAPSAFGARRDRGYASLLRRTCRVMRASSPAPGTPTTCTEPLIIEPEYCVSRSTPAQTGTRGGGCSPPQGFGPAPESFVFVTTSRLPSGVAETAAGYHAVGMKPSTARLARSTTATAFSPASAT
jgi:hypothetical protein